MTNPSFSFVSGGIPTYSSGDVDPKAESLFKDVGRLSSFGRMYADGYSNNPGIKVKKVKVEIFDLSDRKQVEAYESLWAMLLEKTAKMEVVVESHKDLVHRSDGTSYWMKYVEYVEFGEADDRDGDGADEQPNGKESDKND